MKKRGVMKNLVLCVFIMMGVLSFTHAENINECKTDIYFGNGVWNEYEDAAKSQLRLQKRIIDIEIVNGDPLLKAKYGNVKLSYNWGQGHVLDVLEVYYQLHESGQLDGIGFYTAIAALTVSYPHITLSAIAMQALMEPFTRDWEAGNVYEMWQKYYNESFKLGHRVLLVSHSQGNMFANRIHDSIDPKGYQDYFANLQVASPASEVKAPKGDHVTLYGDPIINPIPGSMFGNANGSPGHAFVKAYLDQEDPYTKIVDKMKELLPTLDSEASQWKTDQESNKNTCDYKITVQHRFDPGIEMPFDVYPFASNKKLCQVNGEYVKASCGGENILDVWDGKKDNECLMINNPEEEKIFVQHNKKLINTLGCTLIIENGYRNGLSANMKNGSVWIDCIGEWKHYYAPERRDYASWNDFLDAAYLFISSKYEESDKKIREALDNMKQKAKEKYGKNVTFKEHINLWSNGQGGWVGSALYLNSSLLSTQI